MRNCYLVLLLALFFGFYNQEAKGFIDSKNNESKQISDSLMFNIDQCSDTTLMPQIFEGIKKYRRKLGTDYLLLLHQYVKKSESLEYQYGEMVALDRIGLQYRFDEAFDSALIYHNKALKYALELKDSVQLYYCYNNLGQVYRMQDVNVRAIQYFHKALSISNSTENLKSSSYTMNTLGATYVVQKDYDKAMHFFRESNKIAGQIGHKRTIAYNYGSMGEVFLMQNKNDSAMYYFQESKKLILELGGNRGYAVAEHLIGQAHFALGNYKEAEKFFNIALKIHIKDRNLRYQALCYAYLGKIRMEQNNIREAEKLLFKGKKIADEIHSLENLILINNSMFELYKKTKQWEKAIVTLEEEHAYRDSIISLANAREIQSIETVYEIEQKEQQIKLLKAENLIKNQRLKLWWSLFAGLALSMALVIYLLTLKRRQDILQQDKLKQRLMLSQMNPHFIFNALGSIQNYMYKNDAKSAISYLGNFASLTRSILNNSSEEAISLEEEISTIQNYLELEKMRMKDAFLFTIEVPDEVETEFISVPPMMLQPFVENSIKHGLKDIDYQGELKVTFKEELNYIRVEIEDNGIGIEKAKAQGNAQHRSRATEIFNQRLKVLKRKYRSIPEPVIKDLSEENKNGTNVVVYLPVLNA